MNRRSWWRGPLVVAAVGVMLLLISCAPHFRIGFQGLLTDSSGNPLNGTFNLVFRYWTCASGAAPPCSNVYTFTANNVPVTNGQFSAPIGPATFSKPADFDPAIFSAPLWLEVEVNGQTLSPRQSLTGSPYAMSLVGGAVVASTHAGDGSDGTDINYASLTAASWRIGGTALGIAALTNGGEFIRACHSTPGATRTCSDLKFRVTNAGNVRADGNFIAGGADFAELMQPVGGPGGYEPGDVLIISPAVDRAVEKSSSPNATAVIGVYSTNPGFVGGGAAEDEDEDEDEGLIPVGIVGIVPVKVSAENGAIARGDLLTTASLAGHAMKSTDHVPGAILGKAVGELAAGTGVIDVVLLLR